MTIGVGGGAEFPEFFLEFVPVVVVSASYPGFFSSVFVPVFFAVFLVPTAG